MNPSSVNDDRSHWRWKNRRGLRRGKEREIKIERGVNGERRKREDIRETDECEEEDMDIRQGEKEYMYKKVREKKEKDREEI